MQSTSQMAENRICSTKIKMEAWQRTPIHRPGRSGSSDSVSRSKCNVATMPRTDMKRSAITD